MAFGDTDAVLSPIVRGGDDLDWRVYSQISGDLQRGIRG